MLSRCFALGVILSFSFTNAAPVVNSTHLSSSNYAGGIRFGSGITEVSADIVIPTCSEGLPKENGVGYTSDGWVGLSAYGLDGLAQTGVSCQASSDSPSTYSVWTEWAPAGPHFYNATDFRPGDVVHARVVAHSTSSATTYLENRRTGQKLQTSYKNQKHQLKLGDAEWITESQLFFTELGPEGERNAQYTPWVFRNAEYISNGKKYKFDVSKPDNRLSDTNLKGVKIAKGESDCPGHVRVVDTTPANYTVPGLK